MLLLFVAALLSFTKKKVEAPIIGSHISDFSLQNVDGRMVSLSSFPDAKGFIIIFTCNHCPFAKLYTERLNTLSHNFSARNVPMLAINPMDSLVYEEETFAAMQQRAKDSDYTFPYLRDDKQAVARMFRATHTPHAFVIWRDGNDWALRYAGAIDDNGSEPAKARSYISQAVEELLANKPVSLPVTQSLGCGINYR